MAKVIGIDLGTTNSCVAVMEGGEPTAAVPHVAECILGKTASLAPWFKHHAKAFAVLQIRLDLPTDRGEVTAMQFDAILWEVHASPPQRSNAGCKISQVHFCICEGRR